MNGWKLVICDKHGGGGKADALLAKVNQLESAFLLPAAVNQADINTRIKQVYSIGKRRIENTDTSRYPILLVIDEFTNLILSDWLTDTTLAQLMSIGNEYAGVNVHALIIGHDWSGACVGKERGAAFRRITTHRIAHRLDAAGAQFLLPSGMGKLAEGLQLGQAIYVDDGGEPVLVDAPLLHDEDLRYAAEYAAEHGGRYIGTYQGAAAGQLGSSAAEAGAEVGTSKPAPAASGGSGAEVGAEVGTSAHQDAPNGRAMIVRQMLREKATQNDIIAQVWGATSGRSYQAAADEYREIVAQLVAQ